MSLLPTVPGVYFEPQPRQPEAPFVRTDVVGFVGLEPRIRNSESASRILEPAVPQGHVFQVDLSQFNIDIGRKRAEVPTVSKLVLSTDPLTIPMAVGESRVYSLNAAATGSAAARLVVVAGSPAAAGREHPPTDAEVAALIPAFGDGTTPSTLTGGAPPSGHIFRLDVRPFQMTLGSTHLVIDPVTDRVVSQDPAAIPVDPGQGIACAVVLAEVGGNAHWTTVAGVAGLIGDETPPSDTRIRDHILSTIGNRPWVRIADVRFQRRGDAIRLGIDEVAWTRLADIYVRRKAASIHLTVVPALPPTQLEDWNDYVYSFGCGPEDGTYLSKAIRAYFANGGRRCYVTTVRRPDLENAAELESARLDMVGLRGAALKRATGLERLLLIPDVSIVDCPDLYGMRQVVIEEAFELPGTVAQACFGDCRNFTAVTAGGTSRSVNESGEPLYSDDQVLDTQRRMLGRVMDEAWRVLLLFNVPVELNPLNGLFEGPTAEKAKKWQQKLAAIGDAPRKMSCAALYFPWVRHQEQVDSAVFDMPPTPLVAGVMARRDLARGVHIAPANETLRGAVGTTRPIDDALNGDLYAPPTQINILRAFPGYGVQVWGARTLSTDRWLRYVSVRRCLSAIVRRALAALQPLVFEPHNAALWLQTTQVLLSILLPIYEAGALRGERPEQAFYVRCDASVNPPEQIENGMLVCEVGVAVAAPAEFIVFRIGRREGTVEVME